VQTSRERFAAGGWNGIGDDAMDEASSVRVREGNANRATTGNGTGVASRILVARDFSHRATMGKSCTASRRYGCYPLPASAVVGKPSAVDHG